MFDISKPRFDPLGSSKVIGQGQYGKSIYGFLLEVNSNHQRQTYHFQFVPFSVTHFDLSGEIVYQIALQAVELYPVKWNQNS